MPADPPSPDRVLRVVVAEDQLVTRAGVVALLTRAGMEVVGEAGDVGALVALVATERPDAAVVDLRMPPTHTDEGLRAAGTIRKHHPGTAVLVLSSYADPVAVRELLDEADRVGYLLKDRVMEATTLPDAIRRVVAGECVVDPTIVAQMLNQARVADPLAALTAREREVLACLAEGLSNAAIGRRLFISGRTVEVHVRQLFAKLGIVDDPESNRRVLVVLAYLQATA